MPVKGQMGQTGLVRSLMNNRKDQEAFNSEPLSSIQGFRVHHPEPLSDPDACDSFGTRHAKDKYAII